MTREHGAPATRPGTRAKPASLPGAWPAAVVVALSAVVFGVWARPGAEAPATSFAPGASVVAEVAPQDLDAALDTVSGSAEQLAQLRKTACDHPLAWVTIMRAPGQPPGQIRLQSGPYVSPGFALGETPVRVALPFPGPYAAGHGTIAVLGTTARAVVSLLPAWHVPAREGVQVREVTWRPREGCPDGGR